MRGKSAYAWSVVALLAPALGGCANVGHDSRPTSAMSRPSTDVTDADGATTVPPRSDVLPASFVESRHGDSGRVDVETAGKFFAGMSELSLDAIVNLAIERNPTLAQMNAAFQAAAARYPQAISLDDPMFAATFGPGTLGSSELEFAYRLEASQALPFPGKRRLRGQAAAAETAAASDDFDDARLMLIESVRIAFYDDYLVHRAIEVNEEGLRLLHEFRATAESRYKTGQSPQQDMLQADVEIGRQRQRNVSLERMKVVAQARINTLLHLPTQAPLPPPPKSLAWGDALPDVAELQARAVAARPDLKALANRIAADQASLALAYKEFAPDFEVMASWDKFMGNQMTEMAPMVGARMNVPIRRARRRGAVAEAQARLTQRIAELESRTDQVHFQVKEASEKVAESEKVVRLYEEFILPAAMENINAARTTYATGRIPFLSLIEAQRSLIELRDRYYEEWTEYHRRRAMLDRAVGAGAPSP